MLNIWNKFFLWNITTRRYLKIEQVKRYLICWKGQYLLILGPEQAIEHRTHALISSVLSIRLSKDQQRRLVWPEMLSLLGDSYTIWTDWYTQLELKLVYITAEWIWPVWDCCRTSKAWTELLSSGPQIKGLITKALCCMKVALLSVHIWTSPTTLLGTFDSSYYQNTLALLHSTALIFKDYWAGWNHLKVKGG